MKILVIRLSSLGDVVLSTAAFPNLRAHFPDAEISVLVKSDYADLFDNNPNIDHVVVYDPLRQPFSSLAKEIRLARYDWIIDLHGNLRSWLVRLVSGPLRVTVVEKASLARNLLVWTKWLSPRLDKSVRERILECLEASGVPIVSTETQLFSKNQSAVLETFSIDPSKKLIGIAPGARHKTKEWPAQRFAEAANRLGAIANSEVLILGSAADRDAAKRVGEKLSVPYKDLTGFTSLKELMAVVSKLSFLLTNDSGIMHIADAFKIPLVAIFGPTVRAFGFAPYRPTSHVVEVNLKCRPCSLHGTNVCPLGHHNCMNDVDTEAVLFATSELL
jgi:heptosyltransferase-2